MTTVVNNPTPTQDNGGSNLLIGTLLLIVFVAVLLYFGMPLIRRAGPEQANTPTTQVNVPTPEIEKPATEVKVEVPEINIPDKINVEIKPTE